MLVPSIHLLATGYPVKTSLPITYFLQAEIQAARTFVPGEGMPGENRLTEEQVTCSIVMSLGFFWFDGALH